MNAAILDTDTTLCEMVKYPWVYQERKPKKTIQTSLFSEMLFFCVFILQQMTHKENETMTLALGPRAH